MKNLPCFIDTIAIDCTSYEIVCMPDYSTGALVHDFYIQPANHDFPLHYMFGIPSDECRDIEDAFGIAKCNAPDYVNEF